MANDVVTLDDRPDDGPRTGGPSGKSPLVSILEPLASLKLSVVLFAMAIFIVLAGTFAQTKMGNWQAVDKYFRTPVAFVEYDVFFPKAFFPDRDDEPVTLAGFRGFWFPGGWLIGALMFVNLAAAHGLRFKVQAKEERMYGGLGVTALGVVATWLVVASGDDADGLQASISQEFVNLLWFCMIGGLAAVVLGSVYGCVKIDRKTQGVEWWTSLSIGVGLSGLLGYLFNDFANNGFDWEQVRLKKESMRILWQLIKGQFAALVLLLGCWMLFKKRAGVVLLHAGIGLLMLSELLVGLYAEESQMQIFEGDTVNYSEDIRSVELAFVDSSGEENDLHVVVPESRLDGTTPVKHPDLPFVVRPIAFYDNTSTQRLLTDEDRKAREDPDDYQGFGSEITFDPVAPNDGLNTEIDRAGAIVKLEKPGGKSLGTWVFGQRFKPQKVVVDGKSFDVSLRFARKYHPYSVHLLDADQKTYVGAPSKTKDYSSYVNLYDAETDFRQEKVRIYMNNPLRYRGETLYQSGMDVVRDPQTGREVGVTVLQVVTNQGWMLPYVSCMIVGTGMFVQFLITLSRFLGKRGREATRIRVERESSSFEVVPVLAGSFVLVMALAFAGRMASPKSTEPGEMAIHDFAKLPVTADGRVKPMDSLARNALVVINEREGFKPVVDEEQPGKRHWDVYVAKRSQPAVEWLLEVVTDPKRADEEFPVFRIVNPELLGLLELKPRPGFFRYTYKEIIEAGPALGEVVEQARMVDAKERTNLQRKAMSLYSDMTVYFGLKLAFWDVEMAAREGRSPTEYIRQVVQADGDLKRTAFAIPSASGDGSWEPYAVAAARSWLREYAAEKEIDNHRELAASILEDMKADGSFDRAFASGIDEIVLDKMTQDLAEFALGEKPGADFDMAEARQQVAEMLANPPEQIRPQLEAMAAAQRMQAVRTIEFSVLGELQDGFTRVLDFQFDDDDSPYFLRMKRVLDAYRTDDVDGFAKAVADYRELLNSPPQGDEPPREYSATKTDFETWFNGFAPFWVGQWLYILVFVLAAAGWLGWQKPLNTAALWLLVFTLVLHTAAMVGRIYISGRPPVTNLYSSAVFIAWGIAAAGIVLELVFRMGLANAVSGITGFIGLGIAHFLSRDGDTVAVMEAVLDTNIWLATHVVTVTLGYAATFFAGFFGLAYICLGVRGGGAVFAVLTGGLGIGLTLFDPTGDLLRYAAVMFLFSILGVAYEALALTGSVSLRFDKSVETVLTRMIYGTICFAMFLSFVGTVLGGLWADDSWGRFWGWDPKENGALIIVLWNALVLHARWDGQVKNRGLAMLAVAGNITTAWSWFGTNELGAGLHSYGFTDGVRLALGLFVISQLVVIAVGFLPNSLWRDRQPNEAVA